MANPKLVLRGVSMLCTLIGLGLDLIGGIVTERRETIEMEETVAKEVAKQIKNVVKKG